MSVFARTDSQSKTVVSAEFLRIPPYASAQHFPSVRTGTPRVGDRFEPSAAQPDWDMVQFRVRFGGQASGDATREKWLGSMTSTARCGVRNSVAFFPLPSQVLQGEDS